MREGSHFRFKAGRLVFKGVSFGYGDSNPYVLWRGKRFIVAKKPGTSEWSQIGRSDYYAARYYLFEYESCAGQVWPMGGEPKDADLYRVVKELRVEEPGRFWRATRGRLIKEAKSLDARRRG